MKQLLLSLFILTCMVSIKAQTSFSCIYEEYYIWNDTTETFEYITTDESASLFILNEKETMIFHTTSKQKSTYYVDKSEYDGKDMFTYDVTSDTGNKYYFVFNMRDKQIRILAKIGNVVVLVIYYVKAIF